MDRSKDNTVESNTLTDPFNNAATTYVANGTAIFAAVGVLYAWATGRDVSETALKAGAFGALAALLWRPIQSLLRGIGLTRLYSS
ncbi:MAG TPA: hypothetical protein VGC05_08835 [Mycobacterium sp.]